MFILANCDIGTSHECETVGLKNIIIIFIKKGQRARLREIDVHPINPKTTAPQYQPIDRQKRKGKRVEDYSRDRAA